MSGRPFLSFRLLSQPSGLSASLTSTGRRVPSISFSCAALNLMLLAKRIIPGFRPAKHAPSRFRKNKIFAASLEPILSQAKFDQALRHSDCLARNPLWTDKHIAALRRAQSSPLPGQALQQPPRRCRVVLRPSRDPAHRRPWRIDSASMRQETARSRWSSR